MTTGPGRKPYAATEKDRRYVKNMAAVGVTRADIATTLGICVNTLLKYYRQELETGWIEANANVARSLYKKALGEGTGSVTAAIFWLKARAGWREARPEDGDAPTPRIETPGKKAAAAAAAQNAEAGTSWAEVLN